MATDQPFALLITWTCYGTWLPGDRRGYVSNTLLPQGGSLPKQNTPGTPITSDDSFTQQRARASQKAPSALLCADLALETAKALVEAARKRGWRIMRGAVMVNHVHVVVMDCPDDGPVVRRILKGCSQAALSEKTRASRRWWTGGGSDRYKHGWEAIEAAIEYVAQQPGMLAEIVDMQANPSERRGLSPPCGTPHRRD
jgi:REP element-mobilizing transposase RayT